MFVSTLVIAARLPSCLLALSVTRTFIQSVTRFIWSLATVKLATHGCSMPLSQLNILPLVASAGNVPISTLSVSPTFTNSIHIFQLVLLKSEVLFAANFGGFVFQISG